MVTCMCVYASFMHLYTPIEYAQVFDNIDIKFEFDQKDVASLLPSVNLNIRHKQFRLEHRLVPAIYERKSKLNSLGALENVAYDSWQILWTAFESVSASLTFTSKTNRLARLNRQNEYEFKLKRLTTHANGVECFDANLKNRVDRRKATGETEVCFELGNNSWFGGHESYSQPYWPINTQSFDYVAYVTGYPDDWGAVLEREIHFFSLDISIKVKFK